jgi:hypothetical protein
MFAIIAVILFAIGWFLEVTGKGTGHFLTWPSFLLLGLIALAIHLIWRVGFAGRHFPND